MEKIKLLLYCTKQPPYLLKTTECLTDVCNKYFTSNNSLLKNIALNGKIVAECDFEVEEIEMASSNEDLNDLLIKSAKEKEILKQSCMSHTEFYNYLLCSDKYYAIHIKNLNIFDKPRELSNYMTRKVEKDFFNVAIITSYEEIKKTPQNMMYCYGKNTGDKYILISIRPKWLFKILNGEKTIEVRKKVLKEMITDA